MLILKLRRHWVEVVHLRFAPDGHHLVAGYRNTGVAVWNTSDWSEVAVRKPPSGFGVDGIEIDSTSRTLFVSVRHGGVVTTNFPTMSVWMQLLASERPWHDRFTISIDAHRGLTRRTRHIQGPGPRNLVLVHEVVGLNISQQLEVADQWAISADSWNPDFAFVPNEDLVVTVNLATGIGERACQLVIHRWADGKPVKTIPLSHAAQQVQLSTEGGKLAVRGGTWISAWDWGALDRPPVQVKSDSRRQFTAIAFHPSGRFLAATSNDTTVKLYDTDTWQLARTFAWDIGRLRSIAFSPDGLLAAAGSDSGKIVVWDVDV